MDKRKRGLGPEDYEGMPEEARPEAEPEVPDKRLHRCRVVAAVLSVEHEFSRALGPGLIVDLDEEVAPGVKFRELVNVDWFEEVKR